MPRGKEFGGVPEIEVSGRSTESSEFTDTLPETRQTPTPPEISTRSKEEEILVAADDAVVDIDKIVARWRYESLFPKGPNLKEIRGNTRRIEDRPDLAVAALRGWSYAFDEAERLSWLKPNSAEEDYWDKKTLQFYDTLDDLLWYGLGGEKLKQEEALSNDELSLMEEGGYGLFRKWVNNENFEGHENLIEFLNYDLWFSWRSMVLSTGVAKQLRSHYVRDFERRKELLFPLFEDTVRLASRTENKQELRTVFEGLDNVGAEDEADALVLMEGLTDEERLRVTVEYINTFGFIRAVDLVARKIKEESTPEVLKEQLKRLYGEIQGEEAQEITAELSEIYEKIDFSKYELNEKKLTRKEVDQIEEAMQGMDKVKQGVDAKEVSLLDIGAGTGRHSLALRERGYKGVTAFEYERKHIDFMESQDPELRVIQGDWSRLTEVMEKQQSEGLPVDFAYCLGRTATHNRTASEMLHFFDEVQQVLDFEGRFMFDFPDINWGVYEERTNRLRENLEGIGVEPLESGLIFDGPNDVDRFNRMILKPNQVQAMAFLLGYKLIEAKHELIGEEGEIENIYYLLEKDKNYEPLRITLDELNENLRILGLLDPGADFDQYVDAWGMTLGQALVYVYKYGLGNSYIRDLNEKGWGPEVLVEFDGTKINLETKGMTTRDHLKAIEARESGLSQETSKDLRKVA